MLRARGAYSSITAVNQLPFATSIAFAIGDFQIHLDRETLKAVGSGHAHRPILLNRNQAPVPAYTFLDPGFAAVSAIWAVDIAEDVGIGNPAPMAVIHNPYACAPVAVGLLPAYEEFIATFEGDAGEVARIVGRLAKPVPDSD